MSEPIQVVEGQFWQVSFKKAGLVIVRADSINEALAKLAAGPELDSPIETCEQRSWIKRVIL